jgi:hypothetical protein
VLPFVPDERREVHDHRAGKPPDGVSRRRSTADDVDNIASFDEAQNLASTCVPRDLKLGSQRADMVHDELLVGVA